MSENLICSAKDYVLWNKGHKKLVWLYKNQPNNQDVQNHELIKHSSDVPYIKTMMYDKVDCLFQEYIEQRYSKLLGNKVKSFSLSESEGSLTNKEKRLIIEKNLKENKAIMNSKIIFDGKSVIANCLVVNQKGSYDLVIFFYSSSSLYLDHVGEDLLTYTATTIFEKEKKEKKETRIKNLHDRLKEVNCSFDKSSSIWKEETLSIENTLIGLTKAIETSDLNDKISRASFVSEVITRAFGKDLIQNVYACFLNKGYIEENFDEIDYKKFFLMVDITNSITKIDDEVWKSLSDINISNELDFNKKYPYAGENYVEYYGRNLKDTGSIYDIPRINSEKKKYFHDKGILQMESIHSDDYSVLRPKPPAKGMGTSLPIVIFHSQEEDVLNELRSDESGYVLYREPGQKFKTFVHNEKLKKWLSVLKFPLFFIDYETIMTPIPLFPNMPPLTQVMTQYSVHVLNADGKIEHFDGLINNNEHTLDRLVESLIKGINNREGTYISWNKSFEQGRNTFLSEYYLGTKNGKAISEFFLKMNENMVDLLDVFREFLYYDTRFNGSFSIKRVFPVISPDRNHSSLEISHGDDASEAILKLFDNSITDQEKNNIRRRLREYNALDTEAMLIIYNHLRKIIK